MTAPVKSNVVPPHKNISGRDWFLIYCRRDCESRRQYAWKETGSWSAISFIFIIITIAFLSACNSGVYYQKKIELPNANWAYGDTLAFQFSISDTMEIYNLYLDIEHSDAFSTQNVYMKLYTLFPDGKRLSKQKSFDLFDQQGKPAGACSGGNCQLHTMLQEKAFFNSPGTYEITLEQYTRENPLPGIHAIGLTIESAGLRR